MVFLGLVTITTNPDDQMICIGGTAVMNCGYNSGGIVLVPLARINGTSHASNNPPIAGLPLRFITPANDTNASRIIVGPVGEQFIGTANFLCTFSLSPPVDSMIATLTVVGTYVCMCTYVLPSVCCTYVNIILYSLHMYYVGCVYVLYMCP